jgi:uncharacterized membrane protein YgdD (TMEM256/DUF423 family)
MNRWLFVGAVSGFLAVGAGAFAAHGLQTLGTLGEREISFFRTGADYHLIHSLAIVAASFAAREAASAGRAVAAAWLFSAGVVLFSGSLYLLALTGSTALPLVLATPMGGLCLLAGWALLAFAALKSN